MAGSGRGKPHRPNGAYKLLVHLLYGQYPYMERAGHGLTRLKSIRSLARLLGTQTGDIRRWLSWLESFGYIESLTLGADKRSVVFRIREPHYVLSI